MRPIHSAIIQSLPVHLGHRNISATHAVWQWMKTVWQNCQHRRELPDVGRGFARATPHYSAPSTLRYQRHLRTGSPARCRAYYARGEAPGNPSPLHATASRCHPVQFRQPIKASYHLTITEKQVQSAKQQRPKRTQSHHLWCQEQYSHKSTQ